MSDDRIGQPMSLSQLLLLIGKRAADTQLERGDITKEEHKERIKILFPDLKLIDNKAMGGMMNINDMITPVGYKMGTRKGKLVGDKEKGIATIQIGLMEDVDDINIQGMKLLLQEAADSLDELDKIDKLSSKEIIKMFQDLMSKKGT